MDLRHLITLTGFGLQNEQQDICPQDKEWSMRSQIKQAVGRNYNSGIILVVKCMHQSM